MMTDGVLVKFAQHMVSSEMSIDKSLAELVSSCLKVLEECDGRWIALGTRNPNKCKNMLVQSRSECVAVYSYIYENYCRGEVDYRLIRSKVGDILSTYRDVLKAFGEVDKFIKDYCGMD